MEKPYKLYNDMPRGWVRGNDQPLWHKKIYGMWRQMWSRCYSNIYYFGSLIYPKFDHLSEYVAFIESQPNFEEFCSTCHEVSWTVDKDIKVDGNKNYYPEFMSLVTKSENDKEMVKRRGISQLQTEKARKKATEKARLTRMKPVVGISLEDGSEIYYNSTKEARIDGFIPSCISECCNGNRKSHKGYKWIFLDANSK